MYIRIDDATYQCNCPGGPAGETIRFIGVEGLTMPIASEIALCTRMPNTDNEDEDTEFVLAVIAPSDYARQTYEGGILTLTNEALPEPPSIDQLRAAKISELKAATEQAIFAGVDVTTSFGTLHYPLLDRDQRDLQMFNQFLIMGTPGWLYNAEGQDHVFYPAADLQLIVTAGLYRVTYCRTLYSQLHKWAARETDESILQSITFESNLPEDLAADLVTKLAMIQGGAS